jgi:hypothetical protein
MSTDRSHIIPIDKKTEGKLVIKTRGERISYDEVAKLMRNRYDVFISNLPRRSAYFAKHRLEKLLGERTNAWSASLDHVPGYLFTTKGEKILGRRKIARY